MRVKNIAFSGIMAAILMGVGGAHAAGGVQIASKQYVVSEVAKKANLTEFNDLKGVVGDAESGLVKSVADNAAAIATKANAADVYTRDEANAAFDKINSAKEALESAQAYTNEKVTDLADKIGDGSGSGLLADITELENTVGNETTGLVKDVNSLKGLVGNDTVVNQITSAITALDLANTYDAKGSAATAKSEAIEAAAADATTKAGNALTEAKSYADSKVSDKQINDEELIKTVAPSISYAKGMIDESIGGLVTQSGDNKTAIEAINNTETGILAQAKADAAAKVKELAEGAVAANTAGVAANKAKSEANEAAITTLNSGADVAGSVDAKIKAKAETLLDKPVTNECGADSGLCVLTMSNSGTLVWVDVTKPADESQI